MGAWEIVSEPTCEAEGWQVKRCQSCEHFESGPVAATGHSYDAVVTPPDCYNKGYTTRTCRSCWNVVVDSYVSATGHSFGEWIVNTEPTCTGYGERTRYCGACSIMEYESVNPTGHTYQEEVVEATCTTDGYTLYSCACGRRYSGETTFRLGHDFTDWITEVEPTCEAEGTSVKYCRRCALEDRRWHGALSHSFTQYVSDGNATYDADGTMTAVCDHGCGTKNTITDHGSQLAPEKITSGVQTITNGYLSKIPVGMTVAQLLQNIDQENVQVVRNGTAVKPDTKVGTGMQVQLLHNGNVVDVLTIVVTGDTNGDGNVTVTDMLAAKAHVLKKSVLADAAAKAGDTNGDGAISITDFIQIKAHILGKSQISPL